MSLARASVWRNERPQVDAMAMSNPDRSDHRDVLDQIDAAEDSTPASRMRFGIDLRDQIEEPTPIGSFPVGRPAVFEIVKIFNEAVRPGLSFRQVLRAVTEITIAPRILQAVEVTSDFAGNRVKAWACFFLWAHRLNVPEAQLNDAALALVTAQLQGVDVQPQDIARTLFDLATA